MDMDMNSPSTPDAANDRVDKNTAKTFACLNCTRRKVKCDKTRPTCGSCTKTNLRCVYAAPPPPRRHAKRKADPASGPGGRGGDGSSGDGTRDGTASIRVSPRQAGTPNPEQDHPRLHRLGDGLQTEPVQAWTAQIHTGTLVSGPGRSRYINSSHWRDLGDDEVQHLSNDFDRGVQPPPGQPRGQEGEQAGLTPGGSAMHPLTAAFMGFQSTFLLLDYHPAHEQAMALCKIHCGRVEPLCKILHIPSAWLLVRAASQQPALASRSDECLLFAIYHFAAFAMTDQECASTLQQPRSIARSKFAFAARQALANACFLQTTEMSILQALTLFLLAGRDHYDPHTYWIMTGVAVRIGQRMGLHKDGEQLGLPPFEVQMRRRLFYQLLPLDGIASKMSGVSVMTPGLTDAWDTKPPSNVNDDQLWPQMTEIPEDRKGASEMSFCLARMCVARFFIRPIDASTGVEEAIASAESEVEDRFIRYCDMVNPLHVLTALMTRSAITAMRLRARLPELRAKTITTSARSELLGLSLRILDADAAAYAHPGMKAYMWYLGSFFLYGTWDAFIYLITTLRRPDLLPLSTTDIEGAWTRVEQTYRNHPQLLEVQTQPLHVAAGRLCVKAWSVNPSPAPSPDGTATEPSFITTLRVVSIPSGTAAEVVRPHQTAESLTTAPDHVAAVDMFNTDLDLDPSFDTVDWAFWDQLIADHQRIVG